MEEVPEKDKELSHSAYVSVMNEYFENGFLFVMEL